MNIKEFCRRQGAVLLLRYAGNTHFTAHLEHDVRRKTRGGGERHYLYYIGEKPANQLTACDEDPLLAMEKLAEIISGKELSIQEEGPRGDVSSEKRITIPQLTYM